MTAPSCTKSAGSMVLLQRVLGKIPAEWGLLGAECDTRLIELCGELADDGWMCAGVVTTDRSPSTKQEARGAQPEMSLTFLSPQHHCESCRTILRWLPHMLSTPQTSAQCTAVCGDFAILRSLARESPSH